MAPRDYPLDARSASKIKRGMENPIAVKVTEAGRRELTCAECGAILEQQYGASNTDDLPYVMFCRPCGKPRGEWYTEAERAHFIEFYLRGI